MRTGRPKKPLEITDEDRDKLQTIARRPKSAQAMAMRARIVLCCGEGMSNSEVAHKLRITGATVGKWRERFRKQGLDGLLDEPRVGAPRTITDRQIEQVVTKTLESMPANSTHWSTRLMAAETGLSQNAIVRIWHAFGLQPHRVENFKFSTDPQFVEKVRPGIESDATDFAVGSGCARSPVPRLRAAWRYVVVCSYGCSFGSNHQHLLPAASAPGIPAISQRRR